MHFETVTNKIKKSETEFEICTIKIVQHELRQRSTRIT